MNSRDWQKAYVNNRFFPKLSLRSLIVMVTIVGIAIFVCQKQIAMTHLETRWRSIGGKLNKEIFPITGWVAARLEASTWKGDTLPIAVVQKAVEEITTYGGVSGLLINRNYIDCVDGSDLNAEEKLLMILAKVHAREVTLVGWEKSTELNSRLPKHISKYIFYPSIESSK